MLFRSDNPKDYIMIGDDLKRDIAGAHQVDIPTIWFNPFNKPGSDGVIVATK